MDVLVDLLRWFNTERTTAVVAVLALAGIAYSAQSASAAKRQAKSAKDQAERAKEQVELGRQQVDLLMRQVRQAEAVEAATQQARRESLQPNVLVDIAPGVNDPGVFVLSISNIGGWKMTRRLGGRLTRADAELDRAQRTAKKQVDLVGEPGRGMSAQEAAQLTLIGRTHLP